VRRSFGDASGKFNQGQLLLEFERADEAIRVEGATEDKLKLNALGAGVKVAPLPKLSITAIPPSLVSPQQVESFRKAYAAAASELCLVVEDQDTTRWFSPKFGLVHEKIAGSWTQNLVYWAGSP
jgi:hypothetical protein